MPAKGQKIGGGLAVAMCLAGTFGCTRTTETRSVEPNPNASASAEVPTITLPARVQRGMCVAHNYQAGGAHGYGSPRSAQTLDELRGLGVDWVSLTPFGFMRALDDPEVRHIGAHPAGETDARLRAEIRAARERGLHVLLKPHLWVARGAWRAQIAFGSDAEWDRWFDSYERWMLEYAALAEEERAEILVVGTELRSSVVHSAARWRALVEHIRERFSGKLVYAANWDAAGDVPFWDALDYVGVQFYAPLAEAPGASEDSMRERLSRALDRLERLSTRAGRPVLLTEVGYKSVEHTEVRPFEWSERTQATFSAEHQARAYRLLLEAVRERPWIRGLYWWKWFTNPDAREEDRRGFSPRGKPAEEILRAAFRGR